VGGLEPGIVIRRFMCLEFSKVTTPGLDSLYDLYSFQVIPPLGKVLAGDWESYQYLVESIRQFPDQAAFAAMIRRAGFSFVEYENLTFGVAAIHSGFKL
jgi:2-methoxy-6-polyprenyl-1,4-benzoquinol methylase